MKAIAHRLHGRIHYGWIIAAVIFLALLAAAGVRATPSVLIVPLEQSFGWTRGDDLAGDLRSTSSSTA